MQRISKGAYLSAKMEDSLQVGREGVVALKSTVVGRGGSKDHVRAALSRSRIRISHLKQKKKKREGKVVSTLTS